MPKDYKDKKGYTPKLKQTVVQKEEQAKVTETMKIKDLATDTNDRGVTHSPIKNG